MPDNQALQVFYGTLPLILVIFGAFLRRQAVLSEIRACLERMETGIESRL
jgi:hypothetical protein